MLYRRSNMVGGTFFFTLVTFQRKQIFANAKNINLLREVIKQVKSTYPFNIEAFVLLPDHLHTIWTLPDNDANFSTRWRLIKSNFTKLCLPHYKAPPTTVRIRKNEQCVWQRRFWEHQIRNEKDFLNHMDYIHYNPVKHGYVSSPINWPYSSFHHYVRKGIYQKNWGAENIINSDANIGKE